MARSWIIYLLFLISALALNLFSPSPTAIVILVLTLALPAACAACLRLTGFRLNMRIESHGSAGKGLTARVAVKVSPYGVVLPCHVRAGLSCTNMLTGEKTELPLLLAVTSNNESAVDLDINAANCGRVDFSLEGVRVYDSFGLTCVKRDIRAEGFCLVLPDFFEPEIVIGAASGADKEGAEYSVDKPGYDLSEPLWVREYAEGDSPKAIHWKLSGKLDKLMVREPGLPIEKSFLLLLETGAAAEDLPEPAMRSAAAEVFIALSQGLLAAGLAHTIAWQDRNNESFVRYMVAAEGELSGVLPKILAAGCGADEDGCLAHYVRNFDGVEQSHIVVVSAGGSFGDDGCAPSSVVTRLVGQSPENLHTVVV